MKRILSLVIALVLIVGVLPSMGVLASDFSDLGEAAWAETAIQHLAVMEVINGEGGRMFRPNDSVTREEFIKMIVAAFALYDKNATCNFVDIPADHWAYTYVASAVNNGLVFGVSNTEFGADQSITREDMVTLLYRMMVKLKIIGRVADFSNQFEDMNDVSNYAKNGVLMLYNGGYIQGNDGRFNPKQTATRAESAQIIYNIMTGNINKTGQEEGGSAE